MSSMLLARTRLLLTGKFGVRSARECLVACDGCTRRLHIHVHGYTVHVSRN